MTTPELTSNETLTTGASHRCPALPSQGLAWFPGCRCVMVPQGAEKAGMDCYCILGEADCVKMAADSCLMGWTSMAAPCPHSLPAKPATVSAENSQPQQAKEAAGRRREASIAPHLQPCMLCGLARWGPGIGSTEPALRVP